MSQKKRAFFTIIYSVSVIGTLWSIFTQTLLFGDVFFTAGAALVVGGISLRLVLKYTALETSIPHVRRGIALFAVLILVIIRVIFGYQGAEHLYDVHVLAFIATSFVLGSVIALVAGTDPKKESVVQKGVWNKIDWLVLGVISLIAVLTVSIGLGDKGFQNDQFFHVEAAKGYIETGAPVRWDFTADAPQYTENGEPRYYKRAFTYTWQVAQSVQLFGWSEAAARYPSVAWFVLFIVGAYVVVRRWSGNTVFAALFVVSFLSFDYLLLQSRITRMYSMLICISSAAIYMWYMVYKRSLTRKFNVFFWGYTAIAALLLINGVLTHFLFFIFGFGFAAFLLTEALYHRSSKSNARRTQLQWLGLLLLGILGVSLFIWQVWPFIFTEIGFVDELRLRYELFPFVDLPYQYLAIGLYLYGTVQWIKSKSMSRRYVSVVTASMLLFFITYVDRYQAMRYILFAVPLFWLIVYSTGYDLFIKIAALFNKSQARVMAGLAVVFFLLPIAIPVDGIDDSHFSWIARESRIIDTHAYGNGHNFAAAYEYIREQKAESDVVYAQEFRTYYWQHDSELIRVDLLEDRDLNLAEFKELHAEYGSGWVIWSEGKTHHLRPKLIEYVETHAVDHSSASQLQESNMFVYYLE